MGKSLLEKLIFQVAEENLFLRLYKSGGIRPEPGKIEVPKMFWGFYILIGNTYPIDATCQTLDNSK